jgi:hypothetical protein
MDEVMGKLEHLQEEIDRLGVDLKWQRDQEEKSTKALRITRWLALGALLLGALVPFAGRWLPMTFRTIHAREIIVHDAEGGGRVQILAGPDSASVTLMRDGEPQVILGARRDKNLLSVASKARSRAEGFVVDSAAEGTSLRMAHEIAAGGDESTAAKIGLVVDKNASVWVRHSDGSSWSSER